MGVAAVTLFLAGVDRRDTGVPGKVASGEIMKLPVASRSRSCCGTVLLGVLSSGVASGLMSNAPTDWTLRRSVGVFATDTGGCAVVGRLPRSVRS